MKKVILLASVLTLATVNAFADHIVVRTQNCDPAAMHELLDRLVHEHKAVITDVICESSRPVVRTNYNVAPVYNVEYDYSNIPVVDCVPGPICGCMY